VHTVIETPDFVSDAKNAGMSQEEVEAVVLHVGKKPQAGDRIVGTGGARKIRFAGRSQGKSGGYRVISYFGGDDVPVFFFNVFAKGEKVNLSKAERNELTKILADIADVYRKGVRRKNVKGR
jgi:hypothetical protein